MRRGFRIPLRGFPRPKPAARRASFRGSADDAPDAAKAVQLPEPFPVPFLPKRELVPPERPELNWPPEPRPQSPPQQSGLQSERPKPKPLPELLLPEPPEPPELKSLPGLPPGLPPELPPQQSGPQSKQSGPQSKQSKRSKRSERPKPKPLPEPLSEPLSGQPAPP